MQRQTYRTDISLSIHAEYNVSCRASGCLSDKILTGHAIVHAGQYCITGLISLNKPGLTAVNARRESKLSALG